MRVTFQKRFKCLKQLKSTSDFRPTVVSLNTKAGPVRSIVFSSQPHIELHTDVWIDWIDAQAAKNLCWAPKPNCRFWGEPRRALGWKPPSWTEPHIRFLYSLYKRKFAKVFITLTYLLDAVLHDRKILTFAMKFNMYYAPSSSWKVGSWKLKPHSAIFFSIFTCKNRLMTTKTITVLTPCFRNIFFIILWL